ncbi:MAG: glycosyltransferase [Erysipelotrichaceae bacterium]|nr:glycosyltransferase [Erysipelotrichaceae bacterium]
MPEVSVIIPVYRTEEYLEQCIDSVLAQTFTDFEVILVDDGSPDNCPAICERYASEDKRISVVHQKNGGLSSARNAGLARAKGRYIYFLDSDDYIAPVLLETTVREIRCGYDAVFFSYYKVYTDGSEKKRLIVSRSWDLLSDHDHMEFLTDFFLQSRLPCQVWNVLYDRRVIDENGLTFINEREFCAEDMNFNVLFCTCAKRILSIPESLHYYRIRKDSLSHSVGEGSTVRPVFLGKMGKNALAVKQWMEKRGDCDAILSRFYLIHFLFVQKGLTRFSRMYENADPEIMKEKLLSDLRKNGQEQFFTDQIHQMKLHRSELRGRGDLLGNLYRINLVEYIAGRRGKLLFMADRFLFRAVVENARKVKARLTGRSGGRKQ